MRLRTTLGLSLTANFILAFGWLWTSHVQQRRFTRGAIMPPETNATLVKTNLLIRRQYFTWQEVESDDYPTYVQNLRNINCPEQTIRDLIIADVNALYARKRAMEVITPEQQWWRSLPDAEISRAAATRLGQLEQERRSLLTQLLGTNWETGDLLSLPRPTRRGVTLDGPVLGTLSTETKQAVEEIHLRAQDRLAEYLQAQDAAGRPLDPRDIVQIEQEKRAELTKTLTSAQLEEYLLRFSRSATALRDELGQLKYFNASADEFRALFRATDSIDLQLQALGSATDALSNSTRQSLETQRLAALKNALGPDRYAQFALLHDPKYQEALAAAVQAGAPETANTLYEIKRAAEEEQARIRARTDLTSEQLAIELKKAELEALKGSARAVGQDVPPEPAPPTKPEPQKTHVLKAGESLNFLAQLYGVNIDALRAANPGVDFTRLKGGEAVSIPVKLLPTIPVPAQ